MCASHTVTADIRRSYVKSVVILFVRLLIKDIFKPITVVIIEARQWRPTWLRQQQMRASRWADEQEPLTSSQHSTSPTACPVPGAVAVIINMLLKFFFAIVTLQHASSTHPSTSHPALRPPVWISLSEPGPGEAHVHYELHLVGDLGQAKATLLVADILLHCVTPGGARQSVIRLASL